ncbi:MAG TPA: class I adenylate-forming enzyme family protein [Frankiaceae bacterium]|jgi:acyl-CoA synthetase (AMP-forming)/AMP-acid ligase II|nr:class I adenylate-forming enzyme family protein [Frankiaceae bacterium]
MLLSPVGRGRPELPGLTIGTVFRNAARAVPHRTAAILGGQSLTFGQIDTEADRVARALMARGLQAGSRALCWTSTTLDVVPVFAALARLGVVYCPLPGVLGGVEAAAIARVADPAILIVDDEHAGAAGELAAELNLPWATLEELAAEARDQSAEPVPDAADERDTHVLFFTSGSTGTPKGVVLSHRVNYLRSHPGSQEEARGAMVCIFPLFHMGAWTISLQQWQARDAVVYLPHADGPAVIEAVRRHGAARLNALPAVWQRVLDTLAAEGGQLPSLQLADSGTSATPPPLLAEIAKACPNAFIRIFYGSTEAGNVASLTGDDVFTKPGSCGLPSQATEARIDPANGELCVRGPLLFDGYFGNPDATAGALADGWYRTGDLASVDDDGYLSIVGRAHDVIRSGGESVVPSEVEAVLAGLPGAAEIAVVGLPDATWGEVVCAVVVAHHDGEPPTLAMARERCAGKLAPFKHPRALRFIDRLPRTPATGQLQRRLIVETLVKEEAS